MSDPLTTIILTTGGAIASKEMLTKLLGPTADYLGEGTRDLVKKMAQNLGRVFAASSAKLKGELDQAGQVNARVLKHVWDEGRFVEDVLSAEYFGGLLASSRTKDGQDDTAVPAVALVRSLSADQLRLHFIIYAALAHNPVKTRITDPAQLWRGIEISIQADELLDAMGCKGADDQARVLLALKGLIDNGLLGDRHAFRFGSVTCGDVKALEQDGLVVGANEKGATLFLRVLGLRGIHPEVIWTVQVDYSLSDAVKAAVHVPRNVSCRYRHLPDPFTELHLELSDHITDLESAIDDVKEQIDKFKNESEEGD